MIGPNTTDLREAFGWQPARSRRQGGPDERGNTIVESAVIVSLLFVVLVGIFEGSLAMAQNSNVRSSVNLATRTGSIMADDPDADLQILTELKRLLDDKTSTVRYVIVFKANAVTDSRPPASCLSSAESGGTGVSGLCNVYSLATLKNPAAASFGYDALTNPTATADQNWPASDRAATYTGGRDSLGVYVSSSFRSVTGLIPSAIIKSSSVLRLEARGV